MSYDTFRHTSIYENALRAPSVLERPSSPGWLFRKRGESDLDYQMKGVGLRLDHLIRNALNPRFHDYPSRTLLSAIQIFLEIIETYITEGRLSKTSSEIQDLINPRPVFCRELLAQADHDFTENGYLPVSSDGVRHLILTHGQKLLIL